MTVADELSNRDGCRLGMCGVRVRLANEPGLYAVVGTWWAEDGQAVVRAVEESAWAEGPAPQPAAADGRPGILASEWVDPWAHREAETRELPAESWTLASPWPVVCCRPRRKNAWNSQPGKWLRRPRPRRRKRRGTWPRGGG